MGLVMIGVGIGFGFVSMIAVLLLIPAYLILALPGALVAAVPGGIAYGITTIFSSGVLPWIVGGLAALPFFIMVVFSPVSLLGGLYAVFGSNVWTLIFRQLKMAEATLPSMLPIPQVPQENENREPGIEN
jgi:hypothetical protein